MISRHTGKNRFSGQRDCLIFKSMPGGRMAPRLVADCLGDNAPRNGGQNARLPGLPPSLPAKAGRFCQADNQGWSAGGWGFGSFPRSPGLLPYAIARGRLPQFWRGDLPPKALLGALM